MHGQRPGHLGHHRRRIPTPLPLHLRPGPGPCRAPSADHRHRRPVDGGSVGSGTPPRGHSVGAISARRHRAPGFGRCATHRPHAHRSRRWGGGRCRRLPDTRAPLVVGAPADRPRRGLSCRRPRTFADPRRAARRRGDGSVHRLVAVGTHAGLARLRLDAMPGGRCSRCFGHRRSRAGVPTYQPMEGRRLPPRPHRCLPQDRSLVGDPVRVSTTMRR